METTEAGQPDAEPKTTCFRHFRRETKVRCSRCDRFICPDCMREAPVGFRCPECVRNENKTVRSARTIFGGALTTRPYVTVALIVLVVLAYLAQSADPDIIDRFSNLGAGLIGPDGSRYVDDGWQRPGFQPEGIAHGEWERLLTSAFLHLPPTVGVLGILHILLNVYWMWTLGRVLEEQLGWWRFLCVYLICAFGGSVLAFLISPGQSAVGASGAVFGLAACYYVVAARLGRQPIDRQRLFFLFIVWMVVSAGFTSWEGHLGGLLTGLTLGAALAYAPRRQRLAAHASAFAATTAVLVAVAVMKAVELTS